MLQVEFLLALIPPEGIIMRLLLVFAILFSQLSFADDQHDKNSKLCFSVLKNLDQVDDLDTLNLCTDFFWHNGGYDNGSFNNVIAIQKRVVQIDPSDVESITSVVWLLWSKWVTWKKNPADMPDGELKVDEALQFINQYENSNLSNSEFYLRVALQLDPLLKNHRPDLIPVSIRFYTKVTLLVSRVSSPELKMRRLRAELNLGHWYSFKNTDLQKALFWYSEALQTDPNNKVAKRRIDEIKGPSNL